LPWIKVGRLFKILNFNNFTNIWQNSTTLLGMSEGICKKLLEEKNEEKKISLESVSLKAAQAAIFGDTSS
jgi:hypothetical protein